ncbi:uncharacterized protein LOC62_03G003555 [Vanrija pseudolonga]|uniref:Uncharacterized protein n=1 Tax=Vanrija pseudolonga TaxID=143232 RepID=A0AAF0Y648_9TREE|nr:hypothetical protein LOC62_03G003555 [Vanrija pseudolonga]
MSHLLDVHFWLMSNRDRDQMIMCDNCRLASAAACFDMYDLTEITDYEYGQFCHSFGLNSIQRLHQVAYMGWIRSRQEVAQREAAASAWAARDTSEPEGYGSDGGYSDNWH